MAMTVIMKLALVVSIRFLMVGADQSKSNELTDPLGKVNDLLAKMKAKIEADAVAEDKTYEEFVAWCHTAAHNLHAEIAHYEKLKEKQEAKIEELASDIEVAVSHVEELSGAISTNQAELDQATAIRAKEQADFAATEKELIEASDAVSRAISIISTEMAKNPAALAQIDKTSITTLLQSIGDVVDAAGVSSSDRQKLLAFAQSGQSSEESELGAPAGATYASQSSDIVNVLESLNDKAQDELAAARKVESDSKHNFNMMRQSLQDQMAADTKDMNAQKKAKEDAEDEKAKTEGDLAITVPDLEDDRKSLKQFSSDCMQSAGDHEATVVARAEELKVITEAIQILKEEAAGAGEISRAIFSKYSFVQTASMTKSTMRTRADLANTEVAAMVKKLAREQHSAALTQLASQISIVVKYGEHDGADPFKKIKGLISQMIAKLAKEAEAEATEKAWCDEQMGKTEAKKADLEHDHAKLVAKIDQAVARSTELKEDLTTLHEEVALLAEVVAELPRIRGEEHANFVKAKTDLTSGMNGVHRIAESLSKYYGRSGINSAALIQGGIQQPAPPKLSKHEKSDKAGANILEILDVVESDFASTLTKEEMQEADAQAEFDKIFKTKRDCKLTKEKDLHYKKQELVALEKQISELANDRESVGSELSAVLEYYAAVKGRCVAQPETYEARKARREAEIDGLKQALATLESEAAFLQRKRRMRGGSKALQ